MRLWSLDPSYLDSKGLGGVWREALLAQAVLLGKTIGWRNHSHLHRFKTHEQPVHAIGFYLLTILKEAYLRGYRYSKLKIVEPTENVTPILVTTGQLLYEFHMLKQRLKPRNPHHFAAVNAREKKEGLPRPHPLFIVVNGDVDFWEKSYWKRKPLRPSSQ